MTTNKIDPKEQIRIRVILDGNQSDIQLNSFARKCNVPVKKIIAAHDEGLVGQALVDKFYKPRTPKKDAVKAFLYGK